MEFTTHLELQSQTTRLAEGRSHAQHPRHTRGLHPPRRPIQRHFARDHHTDLPSTDYNSEDFQSELFPLHSQLLRESWLVSSPPLSYMLKFSGYSCLIGGPIGYRQSTMRFTTQTTHEPCSRIRRVGSCHTQARLVVPSGCAATIAATTDTTAYAVVGRNRHSNRHTPPRGSARCVQKLDDSLDFAIRMTYRISLRSSSLWEPRHPLLKLVMTFTRGLKSPQAFIALVHVTPDSRPSGAARTHTGAHSRMRRRQQFTEPEGHTPAHAGMVTEVGNDPSAGSPTETLLRLHLPLNDEV